MREESILRQREEEQEALERMEEERLRRREEEWKRREAEEKERREDEERRRRDDEERRRKEEEEWKRRREAEDHRRAEEDRRREEEDRRRREDEARRRREDDELRRAEDEKRREEDRRRRAEEERRRAEDERQRREEEERRREEDQTRSQEENKRRDEERKRRVEEETLRREEEDKQRREEDERRREEDERRQEADRVRREQDEKRKEEERARREEEDAVRAEEDKRREAEGLSAEAEQRRREEDERRRQEDADQRQREEDQRRQDEEDRLQEERFVSSKSPPPREEEEAGAALRDRLDVDVEEVRLAIQEALARRDWEEAGRLSEILEEKEAFDKEEQSRREWREQEALEAVQKGDYQTLAGLSEEIAQEKDAERIRAELVDAMKRGDWDAANDLSVVLIESTSLSMFSASDQQGFSASDQHPRPHSGFAGPHSGFAAGGWTEEDALALGGERDGNWDGEWDGAGGPGTPGRFGIDGDDYRQHPVHDFISEHSQEEAHSEVDGAEGDEERYADGGEQASDTNDVDGRGGNQYEFLHAVPSAHKDCEEGSRVATLRDDRLPSDESQGTKKEGVRFAEDEDAAVVHEEPPAQENTSWSVSRHEPAETDQPANGVEERAAEVVIEEPDQDATAAPANQSCESEKDPDEPEKAVRAEIEPAGVPTQELEDVHGAAASEELPKITPHDGVEAADDGVEAGEGDESKADEEPPKKKKGSAKKSKAAKDGDERKTKKKEKKNKPAPKVDEDHLSPEETSPDEGKLLEEIEEYSSPNLAPMYKTGHVPAMAESAESDDGAEKVEMDVEEGDEEEEEIDEEALARTNEAVWKWLKSSPDPAELIGAQTPKLSKHKSYDKSVGGVDDPDEMGLELRDNASGNKGEGHDHARTDETPAMKAARARAARYEELSQIPAVENPIFIHARSEGLEFVQLVWGKEEEHDDGKSGKEKYNPRSLGFLSLNNPVRRAFIALAEWKLLNIFILITIAINFVFMAVDDPLSKDSDSTKRFVLDFGATLFIIIFSFECILKIVAYGFFIGPWTYLKDPWNWIDFFIVVTGIVELFLSDDSTARALQAFRLLRPLRAIRVIGYFWELRVLVILIGSCLPALLNVLGLVSFLFVVFSVVGFQLWNGAMRGRCFGIDDGIALAYDGDFVCNVQVDTGTCPDSYACVALGENPLYGVANFDNVGYSMLSIFQAMTLQGWSETLGTLLDGNFGWSAFVYVAVILIGPFLVLKLFLVVISNRYAEVKLERKGDKDSALCLFEVKVGIFSARDLPRMDTFGDADPYVHMRVENQSKKTKVIKNTLTPLWEEQHIFQVTSVRSNLTLTVYDWNRIGGHDFIGQVTIPVGMLDDIDEGTDRQYELEEEDAGAANGVLRVQLQWRKNERDTWSPLPEGEQEEVVRRNQGPLGRFADSNFLNHIMVATVLATVITMAMEHECDLVTQEYCVDWKMSLEALNVSFALVFALEMLIKMMGNGLINYLKDTANFLDMFVVAIGVIEIPFILEALSCYRSFQAGSIDPVDCTQDFVPIIRLLRLVRIARFGRLVKVFPKMRRQIMVVVKTFGAVSSLVFLLLLFVLTFAILGMNLFGGTSLEYLDYTDDSGHSQLERGAFVRLVIPGRAELLTGRITVLQPELPEPYFVKLWSGEEEVWARPESDYSPSMAEALSSQVSVPTIIGIVPRTNFDTFAMSCLAAFQVLTTSQWHRVWQAASRGTSAWASLYFIALILFGNYILVNLFVAIIIQGFAEQREMIEIEDRERQMLKDQEDRQKQRQLSLKQSEGEPPPTCWERMCCCFFRGRRKVANEETQRDRMLREANDTMQFRLHRSFFVRSGGLMERLGNSRMAKKVLLCCIVADVVLVCFYRPGMGETELSGMALATTILFSCFSIELVVSLSVQGFTAYFLESWHWVDLLALVCTVPDMILLWTMVSGGEIPHNLRFLFLLRCLRPLRLVGRTFSLRLLLKSIWDSRRAVSITIFVTVTVFVIFGILGVELFHGKMHFCSDSLTIAKELCVGIDPATGQRRVWLRRTLNYDWIGPSILTVFVLSTKDRWTSVMWEGVDSTSTDEGPYQNADRYYAIYFIGVVVVGGFFVLSLFAGIFMESYKASVNAQNLRLERESSMHSSASRVKSVQPSKSQVRYTLYLLATQVEFDLLILGCIAMDVFFMMFESYAQSSAQSSLVSATNFLFSYIFGAEACIKLLAFHPGKYFASSANFFEFIVVMVSFGGIAIEQAGNIGLSNSPTFLRALRLFRIVRLLRAFRIFNFKAVSSLRQLIETLISSLRSVGHLAILLLLVYITFGILSVQLFGSMCQTDRLGERLKTLEGSMLVDRCLLVSYRDLLPSHFSFQDIWTALLSLLRMNTIDGWSIVMISMMLEPKARPAGAFAVQNAKEFLQMFIATGDYQQLVLARQQLPGCQTEAELAELSDVIVCNDSLLGGVGGCPTTCGHPNVAPLMCSLFVMVTSLVLLNLVLAVLMQQLQEEKALTTRQTDVSLNVLMNVSNVTTKWRNQGKTAQEKEEKEETEGNQSHM